MRVLREALERFDFDSVLLPVSLTSMVRPQPENDFRSILKIEDDKGLAMIAIKAIAKGKWAGEGHYSTR